MYHIYIVEDDHHIATIMGQELADWGYSVQLCQDFSEVFEEFLESRPELVLMDVNLPAYNGFYWTQKIREHSNVPIIFITSRTDDMDLVRAIQLGADDYLQKPFELPVLLAKVQALLRRTYEINDSRLVKKIGAAAFYPTKAEIMYEENVVELTQTECQMMTVLTEKPGEFIPREELMKRLWQDESFVDDNTLAVNMARLRKKLREVGVDHLIETKKGGGYRVRTDNL